MRSITNKSHEPSSGGRGTPTRQGKQIIDYELNLCESTVKVHVRSILKKLNAINRTEVVYKISNLFPNESSISGIVEQAPGAVSA